MPILDVNKMFVEAALTKAFRDMKSDPERTMRNLVDFAIERTKSNFQKALLVQTQKMLQDESSAYYTLTQKLVNNVTFEVFKTFGMNFAYNGGTTGAKTIRRLEKEHHICIPWSISFDMDGVVTPKDVDAIVNQGKALGIYIYQLRCRTNQMVLDFSELFERQSDCAFVFYLNADAVDEELVQQYGGFHNVMFAVACQEFNCDEKFAMLQQAGLLFATHYEYNHENAEEIFSNRYFAYAAEQGAIFAITLPKPEYSDELQLRVYEHIVRTRLEQKQPVLPLEMIRDSMSVDNMISDYPCLVSFGDKGELVNLDGFHEEEQGNILRNSLLKILQYYNRKTET